jgi:predicted ATPase
LLGRIRDVDGISYKYFTNKEELEELIISDLALLQAEVFETVHSQDTTNDNSVRHHAIPAPVTSLLGRDDDVQRATALLQSPEVRLITFTGPGGSGKTRLGIEVARALVNHFPQHCFVALASIQNPDLVADAIAHALGIKEAGEKHAGQMIKEYLHPRRMLLILDNFEQLADAAAPMIAEFLGSCPQLKIIVTSRMSLQIRGEREFPVGPLALPDINKKLSTGQLSDYAAVALFCQRARDIKPGFSIHGKNAGEISRICHHLDGLPLAIELAAARIRLLSPGAMLKRLESKLPLLTGGVNDLPERQQTMRKTIAWSYQLLNQHEAVLFRNMAVFSGGATLETIAAVCDQKELEGVDIVDLLEGLVRKNMVIQLEPEVGELRYGMLETIRDYALGQLEDSREQSRVFTRHAKYFTQLAEQAEPFLTSAQRDEWLTRIEDEMDNFRAVFNRSLSASIDPRYGIRIAGTLGWFWHLRGYLTEGRNWSASLMRLTQSAGRNRLRAKLLFPAGGLAWSQGDYETANRYLGEAAEIFNQTGDLRGLTDATAILAGGLASLGKFDQAQALCEDTACRLRKSGDRWGLAFILYWLGSIILAQNRQTEKAISLFKEIHSIALELNDAWLHAEALNHLGMAMGMKGNFDIANACFEDSMKLHESISSGKLPISGRKWVTGWDF